jgi:dipeptidyl aminopeptidase/acylaminoacyl peptidase
MKKWFLLFWFPISVMAQEKLTPEKLWQIARVSDPQISPNGNLVLFGSRTFDVKANKGVNIIYLVNYNGGEPKAITTAEYNAMAARFRPDGAAVTFLSAISGDVQLYELQLSNGKISRISNVKGGITGYKYAPALNRIAFTAKVKLDSEVKDIYPDLDKSTGRIIDGLMYRHWDSWSDFSYSHLFIQDYNNGKLLGEPTDIMKGERFDCPNPPHGGDDEYNWNPQGTKLAYNSKKLNGTAAAISTNSDIYVYDVATKSTMNISYRNLGYDRNPQFSPDGTKLAWLQMQRAGNEADKNTLVMYDFTANQNNVKGGMRATVEPIQPLTANFDYSISSFQWANNQNIIFNAVVNATKQLFLYNPALKSLTQTTALTKGHHDYSQFHFVNTGKQQLLVGSKMSISMPNELFAIDNLFKGNKERQLTNVNKALFANMPMGKVEERWVKTTDNKQMLTWVIYPPDFDATKKYPTLLYCQGGPQSPVSQFFSYRWNFQLMAAQGYIVVAPNRRGLPGFGSEWNDAIIGDYGGQCMQDLLSAIDDVSAEKFVDKDKLGAVGASFGGYSVYWLAGNHNKRFKTFIAHCGMFNMESWYGSTEEMFFANNDCEGPYWDQTKSPNNFDASPHKFVKNWDTPILVIHNEKDFRVPVTQGMEAFTAAQIKGIPSRFLYFPDENHWMLKPQNSILWQRVFFDWLETTLNK